MTDIQSSFAPSNGQNPLKLAFIGTGWIGLDRMQAMLATGLGEASVICDPNPQMLDEAARYAPQAHLVPSLDAALQEEDLDGVVIATPSALHADQAIAAFQRGLAVFCQKPLGRTAEEAQTVVQVAKAADRLLGVDLCYRRCRAVQALEGLVRSGELGEIFALDLVFHNAYGPDKPWFYDPALSGGGAVIDLGVHLVDLALWLMGFPEVRHVESRLYRQGKPFHPGDDGVEDYAVASLTLASGSVIRLACSWGLHAGQDAVISCDLHGTAGGARFANIDGSFYDFRALHYNRNHRRLLQEGDDGWGGRTAVSWLERLHNNRGFDAAAGELVTVAAVLDRIYGRDPSLSPPLSQAGSKVTPSFSST
ncbi:Gfo/Idh/MocA family oxidoreductase [Allorhizobium sp. BGMRC 0089]|uniref:Gfo/Idh/MocA family protein n=1 Tax=Allorhizobium sonneratiae TaxID=2934936 RepID=UPI0020333387|nr:Gfo/Idh/MocA family oxidoreductase [Allorhizobium sonneratiae]MCM2293990.1 Gfo/Idh/MocA family oxidoreductase [Allorhizobium sonneratiae]